MGTSYWLRKYPKPWVVADWNVLRELKGGAGIPGGFTAVVSDRALIEAINSDSPETFVAKLNAAVSHPASRQRVLIGRYWDDLALRETHPSQVRATPESAMHVELSAQTLQLQRIGAGTICPTSEEIAAVRGTGDAAAERHATMMTEFVEWARVNRPSSYGEGIRADGPGIARAVANASPDMATLVANHAPRHGLTLDYRTQDWVRELSSFPDRAAVAKWMRITFCYALLSLNKRDRAVKRLRNDYDDAFYAFLSLYTGHLWTRDKDLGQVARLVSGGRVQVHTSWESVTSE